jgi:RNA polymerase sigma-70 factor (sigma-E family)
MGDVVAVDVPLVLSAPLTTGFDALFAAYQPRAVRLAGLLTGDADRAEDVAAEAFARVFVKWQAGQVTDFWPYLRMAIVNEVRGRWRRRSAERPQPTNDGRAEGPPVADRATDRVAMAAALQRLSPRQRVAIVLRYYEDLTEPATAAAMGCTVGTVKTTVARALQRLRPLLDEHGGER